MGPSPQQSKEQHCEQWGERGWCHGENATAGEQKEHEEVVANAALCRA